MVAKVVNLAPLSHKAMDWLFWSLSVSQGEGDAYMNPTITQLNCTAFSVPLLGVSFLELFGKAEYFPKVARSSFPEH